MKPEQHSKCSGRSCGCTSRNPSPGWDRRDFLKLAGLGASALFLQPWTAMAGPFAREDFERLVPADKKLSPEWVKSLTARGERTVYRGAELEMIGMPIGGICAGQIYLGGDGKLWHWDIFNQRVSTGAEHYAKPLPSTSPLDQGFALTITSGEATQKRPLDHKHWREVSFTGEYPIGFVEYRDPELPVTVSLEAFSPFIPLNTDDSSLPATVLEFTVKNQSGKKVQCELSGWLENAACLYSGQKRSGVRRNRVTREGDLLALECSAEDVAKTPVSTREDIVFESFERASYENWSATGTAFGTGPVELPRVPSYQGDVGGKGQRAVNSHASAPGDSIEQKDSTTGSLVSRSFTITRDYITFLIGGGSHKGKTCMNLVVDGQIVLSATGENNNRMQPVTWDVRRWAGKSATLHIVDNESGPWGNVGVDEIVFTDTPSRPLGPLAEEADFGTLSLALLNPQKSDLGLAAADQNEAGESKDGTVTRTFDQKLVGLVGRKMTLAPGASAKATFILAWHMPNVKLSRLPEKRHYAARFRSAKEVAKYISGNFTRLSSQTRLWHDTWYDSTLPYWFLDRTFLNTSILASSTCHRFADGRFYAWEGVGCCEGTCGHVWQYAHAVGRLFPELERITRERVDFGLALQPSGAIHFRGEFNDIPAIDAQAGTILRALREHQVSSDNQFLKRNWPKIKQATEWLIAKDTKSNGLIETNQHNTLDTDWFGPVAWLSGLYLSALLAAESMALEMDDKDFASKCLQILEVGQKNLVEQLFDGEYFINKPDPKHLDAINSGTGCEIDQVFGQSWAFQVGLPRVLPQEETLSALKSLWRYNFTPDVGPYRKAYQPGRWYAMPGEAGLLMCSFPRSDWDYAQAKGKGPDWAAGYFNECMNGFEYQVAGHMIWEGMLTEGLVITRAVHDRYHASRRNPWNEVECGDHYARSMASYGVFLAACGFEYHGPKRHLGFAPRLVAERASLPTRQPAPTFKAAFSTAEGWGTFTQTPEGQGTKCDVTLKWGQLRVRTMSLTVPKDAPSITVRVTVNGRSVRSNFVRDGDRFSITLDQEAKLDAGQRLEVLFK